MPGEVTVLTDSQLNVALSLYAARKMSLPRELVLNADPQNYFKQRTRWRMLGLEDHPVVGMLMEQQLDTAMAVEISRSASYLDRVAHLTEEGRSAYADLTDYYNERAGREAVASGPETEGDASGAGPASPDEGRQSDGGEG